MFIWRIVEFLKGVESLPAAFARVYQTLFLLICSYNNNYNPVFHRERFVSPKNKRLETISTLIARPFVAVGAAVSLVYSMIRVSIESVSHFHFSI